MAREDLLAQLLIELTLKEGPPAQDDNTVITKTIAPNDSAQLADSAPTFTLLTPSTFVWGGNSSPGHYVSPGWKWGQGQYRSS